MKKPLLILLTDAYPVILYELFIEDEIRVIAPHFDKIIFMTENQKESEIQPYIPANSVTCKYDTSPTLLNKFQALKYLCYGFFYKELLFALKKLHKKQFKTVLKIMFMELARAQRTIGELKHLLQENKGLYTQIYLYSYWHNHKALALALLRKKDKEKICFARAHGWDVFAGRHAIPYLPFKTFILKNLDCTYSISETGKKEFEKNYGNDIRSKVRVSRLGKFNDRQPVFRVNDNGYLLFSCSELLPVKRVHLIIELISKLPLTNIRWIHYGEGPLRKELETLAAELLPHVPYELRDVVPNKEILDFYQTNPVDLFINLSESEGIPVSIMESLSSGVPVLATDVGGTSEAVHAEHGFLIEKDFDMNLVAEIIAKYLLSPKEIKLKYKQNAYSFWQEHFEATKNYSKFLRIIMR